MLHNTEFLRIIHSFSIVLQQCCHTCCVGLFEGEKGMKINTASNIYPDIPGPRLFNTQNK